MRRGENWESRIRDEINRRSIFYLFWSQNARQSKWVEKELQCALETKSIEEIEPIPLEKPDKCPPPQKLNSKHFYDRMLNYTDETIRIAPVSGADSEE